MTHLKRIGDLKCPWVRAIAYFDGYMARLPASEHEPWRELRLRVPLGSLGLPGDLAVDRDVVTSFEPLKDTVGLEHGVTIFWTPIKSALLPVFRGSLRITAATPKSSSIILDGEYDPPLGALGTVFDAAVGRRVAEATADEMLKTIADRIELDYATDEPHISR